MFFWFRDDEEGRRRPERVKTGLERMVADGTLRKMFDAEFGPALAKLDLAHRLVIDLPNPQLAGYALPSDPNFGIIRECCSAVTKSLLSLRQINIYTEDWFRFWRSA